MALYNLSQVRQYVAQLCGIQDTNGDYDFDFKERFASLKAEFEEQLKEETKLNKAIVENLVKVKIDG